MGMGWPWGERRSRSVVCLAGAAVAAQEEPEDVDLWYLPVPNRRLTTCPGGREGWTAWGASRYDVRIEGGHGKADIVREVA